MNSKYKIALTITCVFLLGCRTVNTVNEQSIVNTSPSLARYVDVQSIDSKNLADGSLKIQITINNKTRFTKRFLYKIDWFDSDGFMIQGPNNIYIPNEINGRETISITSISPKPEAKNYKINFIKNK